MLKILIGGGSSVGKTTAGKELARNLGLAFVELDQIAKGDPTLPSIDFSGERLERQPVDVLVDELKAKGAYLQPLVRRQVDDCSEPGAVIEGEGIVPAMASEVDSSVVILFVVETNAAVLHQTLTGRSAFFRLLTASAQRKLCTVNAAYNAWIRAEAQAGPLLVVLSSPMESLHKRILRAVT